MMEMVKSVRGCGFSNLLRSGILSRLDGFECEMVFGLACVESCNP
jgi:hypothetical protein